MDKLKRVIILCCTSLLCLAPTLSKTPTREPKPANVAQLRQMFIQTFGADFELLGDEVKAAAGEKYWLARVKAKRSGSFSFRYKFQRVNYGYKYGDNEYRVVVGEHGCKRMLFYGFHPDMCVGDAIVLHIQISDYVINYRFSKLSIYRTPFSSSYTGVEDLKVDEVDNPLANHLKFLGRTVNPKLRRDLRAAFVDYRAVFEAKEPGEFKLHLSARLPDALQEFNRKREEENAIPVIIVAEQDPTLTIAAEEYIWESDDAPDESYHPQSASLGGRNHPYGVLMLHPGDRISLTYGGMWLPTRQGLEALSDQVKPIIEKRPFFGDREQ